MKGDCVIADWPDDSSLGGYAASGASSGFGNSSLGSYGASGALPLCSSYSLSGDYVASGVCDGTVGVISPSAWRVVINDTKRSRVTPAKQLKLTGQWALGEVPWCGKSLIS